MKCQLRYPIPCENDAITEVCGKWVCRSCNDDFNIGMTVCQLGSAYSFLNTLSLESLTDTQAMELNDALDQHVENIHALQTNIRREYIRRAEVA